MNVQHVCSDQHGTTFLRGSVSALHMLELTLQKIRPFGVSDVREVYAPRPPTALLNTARTGDLAFDISRLIDS